MAGAGLSAEVLGEEGLGDGDGAVWVVEALSGGGEGDIDPFVLTFTEVFGEGLGVLGEVLGAVELDGVDEDGDDDGAGGADLAAGGAKEFEVAVVEGSHGGN